MPPNFLSHKFKEMELLKVGCLEGRRGREGEKHTGASYFGVSTMCLQWHFYQVAELVNYRYMCACLCTTCIYESEL